MKGIDVSKHQGNIDWNKVKADGIDFAIIRSSYGRNTEGFINKGVDERFEENYAEAKAIGIHIGAYHYLYADTVSKAEEEAQFFLKMLSGKQFDYPVFLDIEDGNQKKLSKAINAELIKTFCEIIENAGYYVGVYSYKSFLDNNINYDSIKQYDIWLAQWASKPTWDGNFGVWQYTSDGSVNGISGRVDMNESYKDYPTIIKEKGLNGLVETPKKETPKKEAPSFNN